MDKFCVFLIVLIKRNVMSSMHIPEFVEIPEEDKLFSVYSKQCHM